MVLAGIGAGPLPVPTQLALCDRRCYIAHIAREIIMATPTLSSGPKSKRRSAGGSALTQTTSLPSAPPVHASVLEEARRVGLLDGDKSEHVSFRAPPALVEAAKRETGVSSTSELGVLALAMLAQPDPVAALMRRTRGKLGEDHTLEY